MSARAVAVSLAVLLLASIVLNYALVRRLQPHLDEPSRAAFVAGRCSKPSLVGDWTFEEVADADRAAADGSGYANHARLQVVDRPLAQWRYGAPRAVTGISGNALELDGRHWLAAGNNDCFTTDRFTLAVWIWLEEGGIVPTIVGKSAWPQNGWWLMTTTRGIQAEDRYLDLGIMWPGGRTHVESGYRVPLHEWHHVVVTVDNGRHEVQFFVDGTRVARKTDVPTWQVNWDHELVIGDYDGSTRWPWIGKLDEVSFYNYVLSEAQCKALYTATFTD